ncbi:hypothetical protein BDN71DRAFT_1255394 [Pleurotus eryngii]|uniref:Uncharacterized protein n=1 Tax=Pleurotus eryngii TaxID=5323 RepID=A0A9P6DJX9_PLEER|nr:hypothetical protein BDN71DRAFT_1255394 [Pleurotus eryngii]
MQVASSPIISGHAGVAFSSSLSASSSTLSSSSASSIFDSRSSHSSSQTDYSPVLEGPKMPRGEGSKYSCNYEPQDACSYFDLDLEQPTPRSYTFNFVQPVMSDPGYEVGGAPFREKLIKRRPAESINELGPSSFRHTEGEGDFNGQNVSPKESSNLLLGLGLGMSPLVLQDEPRIASHPAAVPSSARPGLQRSSTSKLRLSYLAGKIQSLAISPLVNKLHKAGLGSPKSPKTCQSPPTAPSSPQIPDSLSTASSQPPWAGHWSDSVPSIDDIPKPRLRATQLDDIPSPLLSPLLPSPTIALDAKANTEMQAVGHDTCMTVERFLDHYSGSI